MSHISALLDTYLQFTASPSRNKTERACDFEQLLEHPLVAAIKFIDKSTMAVGTRMIYVTDQSKRTRQLGEYIIFLVRARDGHLWRTGFFYRNCSCRVRSPENPFGGKTEYHHPHVVTISDFNINGLTVGKLCMSAGRHNVSQAIREARIYHAVCVLIDILFEQQAGHYPGITFERWPIATGESHE